MNGTELKRLRSTLATALADVDVMLGAKPRRLSTYSADPSRVASLVSQMRSRMLLRSLGDDLTRAEMLAVAQELKLLGWRKRQVRIDGVQGYYWFEPGDHMAGRWEVADGE